MKIKSIGCALMFIFLIYACAPRYEEPIPQQPAATATEDIATPPHEPFLLTFPTPIPGTIAFEFAEKPCSASWSNNGEYLPCPGDINNIKGGYVDRFDEILIDGNIAIQQPGLLTIPAQKDSVYYAIFGKYSPFTVMEGDRFQAVLACAHGYPACDADVSLEYYNENMRLDNIPGASWHITSHLEESTVVADTDLSFLAGQTIQFSLTVRDNGNADDDFIAWIYPVITRIGGAATDAVPPHQLEITNIEPVAVSGMVDMKSAPPYLYDDHPLGSPAAIVFFDAHSEQWVSTKTASGNAQFSTNLYPGAYYVIAYAMGVEGTPYVSAAYTGISPSCGNEPALLQVVADKPISNISINDWNWICGGNAYRPDKPEEVPLP